MPSNSYQGFMVLHCSISPYTDWIMAQACCTLPGVRKLHNP